MEKTAQTLMNDLYVFAQSGCREAAIGADAELALIQEKITDEFFTDCADEQNAGAWWFAAKVAQWRADEAEKALSLARGDGDEQAMQQRWDSACEQFGNVKSAWANIPIVKQGIKVGKVIYAEKY